MQSEDPEIRLFSVTFHKSVFLPLLFRKIGSPKSRGSSLLWGVPFEYTISAGAALGCMAVGFMNYRAAVGLIAGIVGACGFFAMLVSSIRSHMETHQRPTWEGFRLSPFLFSMLAGITVGLIFIGGDAEVGIGMKISGASSGLIMGYMLGIPAGLWIQALGWISRVIEVALVPAMIGLLVVSILMAIA